MTAPVAETTKAVITGSGALIAWFADTLPIVQWCAGAVAVIVGVLTIIKNRYLFVQWLRPK